MKRLQKQSFIILFMYNIRYLLLIFEVKYVQWFSIIRKGAMPYNSTVISPNLREKQLYAIIHIRKRNSSQIKKYPISIMA
jgi:hypothetical protein